MTTEIWIHHTQRMFPDMPMQSMHYFDGFADVDFSSAFDYISTKSFQHFSALLFRQKAPKVKRFAMIAMASATLQISSIFFYNSSLFHL
jgi:hypothetical protein